MRNVNFATRRNYTTTKQRLDEEDPGSYGVDDLIAQFSTVRVSRPEPKEVLSIPRKPHVAATYPPSGSTTTNKVSLENLLKEMNSPIRPELLYKQTHGHPTDLNFPNSPSETTFIQCYKAPLNVPDQHCSHMPNRTPLECGGPPTRFKATWNGYRIAGTTQRMDSNLDTSSYTGARGSARIPDKQGQISESISRTDSKGKGKAVDESVPEIDGGKETEMEIDTHSSQADVKRKEKVFEVDGDSSGWVHRDSRRPQPMRRDPPSSVWGVTCSNGEGGLPSQPDFGATSRSVTTPEERKAIPALSTISSDSQPNSASKPRPSREPTLMDITTYQKVSRRSLEPSPMDTGDDHDRPRFDDITMDVDIDHVTMSSQSANPLSDVADVSMDIDDPDIIMIDLIPPPPSTTRPSPAAVSRSCDHGAYYRNTPRNPPLPSTGTPVVSHDDTYAPVAPPVGKPIPVPQLSLDTFPAPPMSTASKYPTHYSADCRRIPTQNMESQTPFLSVPSSLSEIDHPAVSQTVNQISAASS
ncbi:hypothetical protein AAF712_004743 [Marasmius tenuissimus]|uniref:Uncharacterized protein n=1 Tax=Marasmius tenuissimus TaxID=585030 RepID=A0ABR3A357_9AGAR